MSVAELLEAAIADIRRQGYDPAVLADESCVRTFADLLQTGSRNWDLVADAVAGTPPDVELAGRILRTKLTFEDNRNPHITSFEQDVRIARDSRAQGHQLGSDAFLLAVGPVRPALYRAQMSAVNAVDSALPDASELAGLPGRANELRGRARTRWGGARLEQRTAELDSRAAALTAGREERAGQAQQQVARFVADVAATVVLFNDTFGIYRRQP
ncbi:MULTISPECIES: hypothetical protein [unclassified Streptomyces]|jgi:hypothetical protein|uniref:hypothetical protein n=1 Tax=unclassified Streptomyces TaxID=2593676 RepID=UPI00081BA72D|nr:MULTISPECIES: hypothetical protein [unclassified Streptomyces]MYQ86696.1 hypothetical protein [Streptomyces sp. SID4936]SCE30553.1 hypothetical protein GA0115234_107639 [Streptomyces sp. DvalAA-43]